MRLLGEQHRRPRMPAAELDQPVERLGIDRARVGGEAGEQPVAPCRPLRSAEARRCRRSAPNACRACPKRPAQHVLVAAGEEKADVGRALEDRPHPLGQRVGIPVGLARIRDLLELVDEEDHVLAVLLRDPLRQAERVLEIALRITLGEARLERDLELVAELVLRPSTTVVPAASATSLPGLAGAVEDPVQPRPVGDRGGDERLGELRRVRDPEQVERDRRSSLPAWRAPGRPRRRSSSRFGAARRRRDSRRPSGVVAISRTSSLRPISRLAGSGRSVGKRSALWARAIRTSLLQLM